MDLIVIQAQGPKGVHSALLRAWTAIKPASEAMQWLEVVIRTVKRTSPQNRKLHAMFGDVAAQCQWIGRDWDAADWKRLLVDAFQRATITDPEFSALWAKVGVVRTVPSLDGAGVVTLGLQTRDFPVELAGHMIEWLLAWGAEAGVEWSEA